MQTTPQTNNKSAASAGQWGAAGETHNALFRQPLLFPPPRMYSAALFCLFILIFFFLHWKLLFLLQCSVFAFAHASSARVCRWSPLLSLFFFMIFFFLPSLPPGPLFSPFVLALCRLCTHGACQTVWVCRNDNGPRSGVSAREMGIGYFLRGAARSLLLWLLLNVNAAAKHGAPPTLPPPVQLHSAPTAETKRQHLYFWVLSFSLYLFCFAYPTFPPPPPLPVPAGSVSGEKPRSKLINSLGLSTI